MPVPPPWTTSRPLPPLHGILAVDVKGSTRLPAVEHSALSRTIVEIVDRSLAGARLGTMALQFPCHTGDGLAFGFDPRHLPTVVSPFIDTLNDVLLRHNENASDAPLRLRLSLHSGHVPRTGGRPGDGNATPRSETHRLLDCRAARQALDSSSPRSTPLVAILSDRVYRDAVVGGYCSLPPERLTEVVAEVDGKDFSQSAWMYVPTPSGDLLRGSPAPTPRSSPGGIARRAATTQHVESGIAVMGSVVHAMHHHGAPPPTTGRARTQ